MSNSFLTKKFITVNNKKERKLISHSPTKFISINNMANDHTTCQQNFQTNHIVQD
jgi:hypothetical protein